jgi:short subunit dehydrogenase-like uncharacterized protein
MRSNLLIYGVTGYLGGLISRLAAAAGLPHVAAGRDLERVQAHADRLLLPARAFSLTDPAKVERGLAGAAVVLNAAAPFAETALPLAEACLRGGVHYLDLADAFDDLEAMRQLDARGREAGVMLLPGAGFAVVPTDALAARLRRRLPSAVRLRVACEAAGALSRGALAELLDRSHRQGRRRRQGELVDAWAGEDVRRVDLGAGPRLAVTDAWRGDLVSAYWSAVFSDIDTYAVHPPALRRLIAAARPGTAWRLLGGGAALALLRRVVRWLPPGPDEAALAAGATRIWAEAEDAHGNRVEARLRGPHCYLFTARAALWIAQRVLAGRLRVGFQTPATAYGPDLLDRLVEEIEDVALV